MSCIGWEYLKIAGFDDWFACIIIPCDFFQVHGVDFFRVDVE